jgi:hypothetical protein
MVALAGALEAQCCPLLQTFIMNNNGAEGKGMAAIGTAFAAGGCRHLKRLEGGCMFLCWSALLLAASLLLLGHLSSILPA